MEHPHDYVNDTELRHTGHMDLKHTREFMDTGNLQLPLFDTADFDRTWKTEDSWAKDISDLDEALAVLDEPRG